jgi:hypothetical protein
MFYKSSEFNAAVMAKCYKPTDFLLLLVHIFLKTKST